MTAPTTTRSTSPPPARTVIGRDARSFGRTFRLVSGALLVTAGVAGLATGHAGWALAARTLGWLAGLVVFYLLLYGSAVLAAAVAGWYLVAAPVLDRAGIADPVSRWWALLLLAPAALLAWRTWRSRRERLRGGSTVGGYLLGSAALIAGVAVLIGWLSQGVVFAAAVLVGLVAAGLRALAAAARRHRQQPGRPPSAAALGAPAQPVAATDQRVEQVLRQDHPQQR